MNDYAITEAYLAAATPKQEEKIDEKVSLKDVSVVSFDWKDIEAAIKEFSSAIKHLGGSVIASPYAETDDQFVFYVSKKKLSKKDAEELDSQMY